MKSLLRYSVLSLLVFALVPFNGCNNDDNGNGPDKNALLTSHIWNFENLSTTSTDALIQLTVTFLSAFFEDATMNFKADGTYTMTMLNPLTGLAESEDGTWEWNADETQITLDKGTDVETIHVITTLTSDVLEINESMEDAEFGIIELSYRWVK